jgi:hypothetical protein
MQQLAAAVKYEIAFQTALWQEDYTAAMEAAREVIGLIIDPGLRGYRALWNYLAGSAAEQAGAQGVDGLAAIAITTTITPRRQRAAFLGSFRSPIAA